MNAKTKSVGAGGALVGVFSAGVLGFALGALGPWTHRPVPDPLEATSVLAPPSPSNAQEAPPPFGVRARHPEGKAGEAARIQERMRAGGAEQLDEELQRLLDRIAELEQQLAKARAAAFPEVHGSRVNGVDAGG